MTFEERERETIRILMEELQRRKGSNSSQRATHRDRTLRNSDDRTRRAERRRTDRTFGTTDASPTDRTLRGERNRDVMPEDDRTRDKPLRAKKSSRLDPNRTESPNRPVVRLDERAEVLFEVGP